MALEQQGAQVRRRGSSCRAVENGIRQPEATMRIRPLLAGVTLLIVGGCADDGAIVEPTSRSDAAEGRSSERAASGAQRIAVSGTFAANVDFSTLTLTPRGRNCLLEVDGALVFSGTIEGTATGRTAALVFAPCDDVATTAPGTYRDVFRSELMFEGEVDGQPASANVLYMGGVQPGGTIDGRLVFSNGLAGRLDADAVVAVGGDYEGSLVMR
jgi:hypothetical protein